MAWSKNSFDTKFELDKQYGSVVEMARRCKNATDIFFYIETIFEKDADPDGVEMLRKEFTKAGYGPEFDEDMANVVVNAMKTPILAATGTAMLILMLALRWHNSLRRSAASTARGLRLGPRSTIASPSTLAPRSIRGLRSTGSTLRNGRK